MNLAREIAFRRSVAKISGQRLRRRKIPAGRASARARLEYQKLLLDIARAREVLVRDLILPELETWRRQSAI
jgi:hypothetical protein